MQATAEQLSHETQKSFDPLASVDLFRYDLENYGQILPETRERVCDQELSYLAEGVGRAARTSFVLKKEAAELIYFDRGEWKPYLETLNTGYEVAQNEAKQDFRRQFLVGRAAKDLEHHSNFKNLEPGQKYSWYSSYADREEALYGDKFVDDCGLVSARKMGFIYQATGLEDGSILLESQTVDNSYQEAFDAAMLSAQDDPYADLDELTQAYDDTLMNKHGEYFFAGRRDADYKEDAWQAIKQHQELIEYHLTELEDIARRPVPRHELERPAKEHVYGVWAAFKKRLDGTAWKPQSRFIEIQVQSDIAIHELPKPWYVAQEVRNAYKDFASRGEVLVGCGGSIKATGDTADIMDASPDDVFTSIFGKGSKGKDDCEFTSKECPVCHTKNVKTRVTKTHISGSCGCSKKR
jgi:hypothetical protein